MYKKFLISVILILMLINSGTVYSGALCGLLLWFNTIVPTLFPFMIISYILKNVYEDTCKSPVLYCILLGLSCGMPIGVMTAANAYNNKQISRKTAYLLCCTCNMPGPAFVISYIAGKCLNGAPSKFLLLTAVYLPSVLILILYGIYTLIMTKSKDDFIVMLQANKKESRNAAAILNKNINNNASKKETVSLDYMVSTACDSILCLGGYIMLSSILAQFVKSATTLNFHLKGILIGLFEITAGINYLSENAFEAGAYTKTTALILFINAFGGLSCILQAYLFIKDTDLSIRKYVLLKLALAFLTILIYLYLSSYCFSSP